MTVYTYGMAARGGRLTSVLGFSQMLDKAAPYGPVVFRGSSAYADIAQAASDVKHRIPSAKLVIAGYSLGAANAVSVAHGLAAVKVPIDLLFLLVPPKVLIPANVKRCVNHTVRGGWFLSPGWSSDIVSVESADTVAMNYDYGSLFGYTHVAIQWNSYVHDSFVKELEKLDDVPAVA